MQKSTWFLILVNLAVLLCVIASVAVGLAGDRQAADPLPDTTQALAAVGEPATDPGTDDAEPPETAETTAASVPDAAEPPQTEPAPPATEEVTGGDMLPTHASPAPSDGDYPSSGFGNALFIGDSRTVGLRDYGGLSPADVFAANGLNVFRLFTDAMEMPGLGQVTLETLLCTKQYDRIYLMLGINEIGYDLDRVIEFYEKAVNTIQTYQPGALIYIEANLMIRKDRSDYDPIYNNKNMRYLNEHMAALADGDRKHFVDVNPLFDDGEGNLAAEYTIDDFHLLGRYYTVWANWLCANTCK